MNKNDPAFKLDAVTFGEAMAMFIATETGDLAAVDNYTRGLAGAETNVAVGLSRLGLRVGWISRLGADSFARFIRATLAREGVDTSHVATDPQYLTGLLFKTRVDDGSDPKVEYFRRNSAASHLSLADFDADYVLSARHLHASGVAPALSETSYAFAEYTMDQMRAAGRTVSFDPNLRPGLWSSQAVMVEKLNRLAARATWVFPGVKEGAILTGFDKPADIAAFYLDLGAQLVAVKLGAEGAYWRTATEHAIVRGVPVEHVVDTVGAGDGFAAGMISALLEGENISDAVSRGNRVGAFAIQVRGDMDGLPTRPQLGLADAA
ncbi:MAG: sugar kinase [Azospirillaceae bacterium]|nr:sugar kinase [Azospirillaceae bacterium]